MKLKVKGRSKGSRSNMDHVFVCGLNRFHQIQLLEDCLLSFADTGNVNEPKIINEQATSAVKVATTRDNLCCADREDIPGLSSGYKKSMKSSVCTQKIDSDGDSPVILSHKSHVDTRTRKRKGEPYEDEFSSSISTGVGFDCEDRQVSLSVPKCATLLRKLGSLDKSVQLEHAEMTWSRFGLTLTTGKKTEGNGIQDQCHHTVICGFSSTQQKTSQPLQLTIADCQIRASNQTEFLLEQNNNLMLLREDSDQAKPVNVCQATASGVETRECIVVPSFGTLSGTAMDFVASYDGISIGKLSRRVKHTKPHETGTDKQSGDSQSGDNQSGDSLWLTCLDSGLNVQLVSCGLEHALFLTCHGSVLSYGSGSRGQLGHGSLEDERTPRLVSVFDGVRCMCVAAGGWHSAVVTECGDLFMWGWNESGQLGLPSPGIQPAKHFNKPQHHPQQKPQQQQQHHFQEQQQHQQHFTQQHLQQKQQQHDNQEQQQQQPLLHQQDQQQHHQEQQLQQDEIHQEQQQEHLQQAHQHHQQPQQQQHHQHQLCQKQKQQKQQQQSHPQQQHQLHPEPQFQEQTKTCQEQQQEQSQDCHHHTDIRAASLYLWPQAVDVTDSHTVMGSSEEVVVTQVVCGDRHTAILTAKGEALTTGWNKYGQLGLPHMDSVDRFTPVRFGRKRVVVTQLWCGAWNSLFVVKELSGTD